MQNSKMITIFSMKFAGYLMQKGFVLVAMEPSKNGSGRNVFHFNRSPAIEKAMAEYSHKK